MHFLTDKANKKKMDAAWVEGFEANSPSTYGALTDRVQTFADLFPDMKVGDVIELTMVPGGGTSATLNGEAKGVIDGDDFAEALLKVWLGDHPPSDELKTGMLGQSSGCGSVFPVRICVSMAVTVSLGKICDNCG